MSSPYVNDFSVLLLSKAAAKALPPSSPILLSWSLQERIKKRGREISTNANIPLLYPPWIVKRMLAVKAVKKQQQVKTLRISIEVGMIIMKVSDKIEYLRCFRNQVLSNQLWNQCHHKVLAGAITLQITLARVSEVAGSGPELYICINADTKSVEKGIFKHPHVSTDL